MHVKRRIHFDQIADILHIPAEELKVLNPQYRKDLIPGSPERPCPLVLPQNQIYSYIMSEDAIAAHNADLYARRDVVEPATGMEPRPDTVDGRQGEWITTEVVKYHKVRRKETLASIAKKYGVTLRSLKQANGNIRKPRRGQTIKVVTTQKEFRPFEEQPVENDKLLVRNPEPETTVTTAPATPEADSESAATPETTSAAADVTPIGRHDRGRLRHPDDFRRRSRRHTRAVRNSFESSLHILQLARQAGSCQSRRG